MKLTLLDFEAGMNTDEAEEALKRWDCHYNLLDQLKKSTHQLRMRNDRTDGENEAIATADKAIAKAETNERDANH